MKMISLKDIETSEWTYYGQWKQPLFSAYTWVEWYDLFMVKQLGISLSSADTILANGHFIVKKSVFREFERHLSKLIEIKDSSFMDNFTSAGMKIFEECQDDIAKLNEASPESFSKFIAIIKKAMAPWYISCLLSFCLEPYLSQEISTGITKAQAMALLPTKETLVMKQYREALEIKKIIGKNRLLGMIQESPQKATLELKKNTALWRKMEQHVETYTWIGVCNFVGDPLTIKNFLVSLPTLTERAPINNNNNNQETSLFSDDQLFIPTLGRDIGFMRQYGAEINSLIEYKAFPFLHKIAKELGLTYTEMLSLTPLEIAGFLRTERTEIKTRIQKRQQGYVLAMLQNKEIVIDNPAEVSEFLNIFVPKADISLKEIRGTMASGGYARGQARIILSSDDFKKMKVGNILITTMTTPDFVPLMQKSAAIVTDIGGLLSHAAIVSREFNIPCLVGTQYATKVFKDRDMVEVDADKGVVRKL